MARRKAQPDDLNGSDELISSETNNNVPMQPELLAGDSTDEFKVRRGRRKKAAPVAVDENLGNSVDYKPAVENIPEMNNLPEDEYSRNDEPVRTSAESYREAPSENSENTQPDYPQEQDNQKVSRESSRNEVRENRPAENTPPENTPPPVPRED